MNPNIAVDSHNRPQVTYDDQLTRYMVLYCSRNSGVWSAPLQLHLASQYPRNNSMALSPANDALHVVWFDSFNGSNIFYNHAYVGATTDVIVPSVSVTFPSSGQTLPIGSAFNIQWSATDDTGVSSVDLAFTIDGGTRGRQFLRITPTAAGFSGPCQILAAAFAKFESPHMMQRATRGLDTLGVSQPQIQLRRQS